jgi:hypothetical protein
VSDVSNLWTPINIKSSTGNKLPEIFFDVIVKPIFYFIK